MFFGWLVGWLGLSAIKKKKNGSHIISVITNVALDKRRNQVTKKSTTSGSTTEAVTKWKAESS